MPELGRTDIARRQTFRLRKRWLALPVLALAVWLAGVSLFSPPPPPRPAPIASLTPRPAPVTATDFLAQGDADFELEYYDQAIADYSRAIDRKPDYADAFNNRAYTYMTMKEYALALPDLDQAIRIRPDYVHALMNRGDIYNYYYLVNRDRAIADYDRALASNPSPNDKSQICGHRDVAQNNGVSPLMILRVAVQSINPVRPSPNSVLNCG